ncbi:neuronal acetylcholine receptor subunit alpha-6-like [Mercenaria mercenaria]|uniref:neuronal acetylcholine receptor subunit alpha-6-like n=1 Tax=Mercenaria mercenaria TaxID=6596 RepID=UPI00234ECDD6|nr:neuronal acetylcholine receptor subunit alpha-6-like [Mercenaria mercenaria]
MVCVSASLVQTVIVLNVFYRGSNGRTVPRWARVLFFRCIGKMLCVRTNNLHVVNPVGKTMGDNRSADEASLYNGKEKLVSTEKYDKDLKATSEYCDLTSPYPTKKEKLADNLPLNNATTDKNEKQLNYTKNVANQYSRQFDAECVISEWRDLANVLDRMFFILYLLATLVTSLAFILQCL